MGWVKRVPRECSHGQRPRLTKHSDVAVGDVWECDYCSERFQVVWSAARGYEWFRQMPMNPPRGAGTGSGISRSNRSNL